MAKRAKLVIEEEDIISTLPEEILSHIISFLPFKEAIRTCVLSRRWSKIFTLLTNLEFYEISINGDRFINFVDRFLSSHTGIVDKLSIRYAGLPVDSDRIDQWIAYAASNKVKKLDVFITQFSDTPYNLSFEILFTCSTLEVLRLKLNPNFVLKLPQHICTLPSLKCLHLFNVVILDENSIQRFVSNSPVLEELVITESIFKYAFKLDVCNTTLKRLIISSNVYGPHHEKYLRFCLTNKMVDEKICLPSLKYLHLSDIQIDDSDSDSIQTLISRCSALEELIVEDWNFNRSRKFNVYSTTLKRLTIVTSRSLGSFGKDYKIRIDAPSLVYFNCSCKVPPRFSLKNLNSLAQIHIHFMHKHRDYRQAAIDLFKGITNVQSLHLYGVSKALLGGNYIIPELPNLTYLTLDSFYGWERLLQSLISCSPGLKALHFKAYSEDLIYIINKVTLPSSLWTLVKRLAIFSFKGEENELQIVEYILKNAKALVNLIIQIERPVTEERRSNITETLLKLPKISENCKILIV